MVRNELFSQKRTLKKLVEIKKRAHKQSLIDDLTNNRLQKNPKEFWKTLEKLKPK